MTHAPVVLVYIYACKHVLSPLPQDIRPTSVLPAMPIRGRLQSKVLNLCQRHIPPVDWRKWQHGQQIRSLEQE